MLTNYDAIPVDHRRALKDGLTGKLTVFPKAIQWLHEHVPPIDQLILLLEEVNNYAENLPHNE